MKVLLSAFACEPNRGSEPGVGWNYAVELSKNNEVTVVTSIEHREKIELYLKENPMYSLPFNVVYHGNLTLNKYLIKIPHHLGYNVYALYWYATVGSTFEKLHKKYHFDVAHHITWATFKYYDPICELGIPYIIGPVGGGELTPDNFSKEFSIGNKVLEKMRIIHLNRSLKNKKIQKMLNNAAKVIVTTPETKKIVEEYCSSNLMVMQAIGLTENQVELTTIKKIREKNSTIQLLFLGELKFWKGIDLLIKVANEMKKRDLGFHFNIVGAGHDEMEFKRKVSRLELEQYFTFHGRLNHEAAMEEYQKNDIFVYPSYHDSGALVVFEAMAKRIPTVVLNTGGPGYNIETTFGFKVDVHESMESTAVAFLREIEKIKDLIISDSIEPYIDNATSHLLNNCLWSNRAQSIDECYREVIEQDRA